jgi:hypothetical protein
MHIQPPKTILGCLGLFARFLHDGAQRTHLYLVLAFVTGSTVALSAGQRKAGATLEAERFVLLDGDGTKRLELAAANGRSMQTFFDKAGKPRLIVGVDDNGEAGIHFLGNNGKLRLDLGLDPDGDASLSCFGEANDKGPSVCVGVGKDGRPAVTLMDKEGHDRIALYVAPDNSVGLTIHDSEDKLIFHQGK